MFDMTQTEIISIGDEILIGQIVNNNAAWMAQQLNLIGISVRQITTVGDNREELLRVFSEASQRAEIILITGGLGPTNDDVTKPCLCEFFGVKQIFNEKIFEEVKRLFAERNLYMPPINRGQAELPENCVPIKNHHGTAPGMWFDTPNKARASIWVSLPGVPYEMEAMMRDFVIPELQKRFQKESIVHKTIHTQGMGESMLAEKIKNWEDALTKENIKLAYLPSPGLVKLRLTAKGRDEKKLHALLNQKIEALKKIIPQAIFAVEEFGKEPATLEKLVGEILREKHQTLAIAESCTGGYLGHLITSIPGSSDYFKGGIICYANEVKIKELAISEKTLLEKGAVSKEVAEQMAENVRKKFSSDYGIGISGIAGPTGGSIEKPVGTVWIAVSFAEKTLSEKFNFGNNRERNIKKAAISALTMLKNTSELRGV